MPIFGSDEDRYTTWKCPSCHNYFGRSGKCSVCGDTLVQSAISDAAVNRIIYARDIERPRQQDQKKREGG